jgi:hypothetical protein
VKAHTSSFKEQIKLIGKEIDSRITFGSTVLGKNDLNAVTPSYQGAILKSVMKQLDIDSNVAIPIGTILKYEFGLKVNGEYEYINYGNYIVYSIEKQEDTKSYKITCYDKLLYSMLDYVKLPITYPISIRDYINAVSIALGLKFANKSGTFANYNKQIQADLYDGLGYTFRDILDELAQVTASTICLNNNDELEIRYITETEDTIDEEFLKDVNVNFGEKFGAVNTIVLSRSGDSDSVYYPSVLPANPYEIKISDNQIMNGNDRTDFLPDIYNKLNGLEFYTNDFVSTGICYYDLCDRYSVKVGDNTYSCVMFNDEVLVTQGLEENVYTELPKQTETDYKHASKDDRMINQVYIIAKKNEAEILAVVNTTNRIQKEINPTKDESGSEIIIEDASNNPLTYLEIEGKSTQDGTPTPETPVEIESVGTYNVETGKYEIEVNVDGKNKLDYKTCYPITGGAVEIGEDKIKFTTNASCYGVQFPEIVLKANTTYSMYCDYSFTGTMTQWGIRVGINGNWTSVKNDNLLVFTTDETGKVTPTFYVGFPYTKEGDILELSNIRIYEGQYSKDTIPDYEPYQKDSSLIVLNQPLRSLPNEVKDIAYIKNNKLYVDRYVGSIVLNGSETWGSVGNRYYTAIELKRANTIRKPTALMSNYFKSMNSADGTAFLGYINESYYSNGNKNVFINYDDGQGGFENFKNWLLTHNTEVTYELAEPYTEELGEIEMPKTLKGYNNITTTDDLLPIINLTYVRDTILADYVENHVAELKLTESEIKISVEKVSSSVDGLNTSINRVEEITTDNLKVINIISTNIDKTSGEVREVTTTTGFTFNADGMTINDGSGFKAEHKANGTYYKDGNSIVGEYTKDGSKQKDLELFGTYSYGMKDKDDTPMFVGQLYNDGNGEECFGHFYNGGDY